MSALDSRLTQREDEIVSLIGAGLSNKEIARQLCISLATVKNHVHNILQKLNIHRRGEVARLQLHENRWRVDADTELLYGPNDAAEDYMSHRTSV